MVTARLGQSCALAVATGASKSAIATAFALSMLSSRALNFALACLCLRVIVFPNSADFNPR
jgi:hypothetical protein